MDRKELEGFNLFSIFYTGNKAAAGKDITGDINRSKYLKMLELRFLYKL